MDPTRLARHCRSVWLLLGCAACAAGADANAGLFVVRDSAGITVVETATPSWSDTADAWAIDPRPVVEIGLVDGEAPYLLDRVEGATRLEDGRIVIANGGSNQLRFFDGAGVFLQAVGREGGGPGEFEYMRGLGRCGADSLFAFDLHWQAKVFTREGVLAREMVIPVPGSPVGPYQLACSPSGGFVVSGWGRVLGPRPVGFYRSMTPIWILDANGRELASLGEHLGSERIGRSGGSGPHPFGRTTTFAFGNEHVFVGSGERFEVMRYSRDGRLDRIQRAPPEDLTIGETLLDAYRAQELARAPAERHPAVERRILEMRELPMPEGVPAFTAMQLDADEHLWVRRFLAPGDTRETWGIFDPDGVFLGHLAMLPGFALMEIGGDYVLGLATDELGVQRVRVHALHRRR